MSERELVRLLRLAFISEGWPMIPQTPEEVKVMGWVDQKCGDGHEYGNLESHDGCRVCSQCGHVEPKLKHPAEMSLNEFESAVTAQRWPRAEECAHRSRDCTPFAPGITICECGQAFVFVSAGGAGRYKRLEQLTEADVANFDPVMEAEFKAFTAGTVLL